MIFITGCQTCECNERQEKPGDKCAAIECNLDCKYGLKRDASDCKICACNLCPMRTCRMYCTYGFRRNEDGCEICECDWSPVSEKIQCSEVSLSCYGGLNVLTKYRMDIVRRLL